MMEDSESTSGFLACPICGLDESKVTFTAHLESHTKQSLIDILLQQQEVLQSIKPGTSRSHVINLSGRKSPKKSIYNPIPSKCLHGPRRNNLAGNNSRHNLDNIVHSNNVCQSFSTLADISIVNSHQEDRNETDQAHPIENIETIEQVHGDNGAVILYQLELQNSNEARFENNCNIPFTTIEPVKDPLSLDGDPLSVIVHSKKSRLPNNSFKHATFSSSSSSIARSRLIGPGNSKIVITDDSFSNSNNTHSQGVVDLMTDEEIPPRGEISEYEESSSNTSSFHSANDDAIIQKGSNGPSLGSLFSDVRRISPVLPENDSWSGSQPKTKKRKTKSQTSPIICAVKSNPDRLICLDCSQAKYFGSIFELAQHQAEAHPEKYKSFRKQHEQNSLNVNSLASLPWTTADRKPITLSESDMSKPRPAERKRVNISLGKKFSCLYCNFVGQQRASLTTHMSADHPNIKQNSTLFECRNCGRVCKTRTSLVKHLLIHNGKKHSCSFCFKRFTSNFKLKEHERVHTKVYPFKCSECEKQFRTPSLRTAHLKKVHLGEVNPRPRPEYYCKICRRILRSKKSLTTHMESHSEQKIQKCPHCPETFQKHRVLVRHIRSNHDSKFPAKESKDCPICHKKLHPNSMRSHLRIHNNEKPYACSMCSLTFRTYSNLTSHSWSHTNVEKPYKCTQCSKSYLFKKVLDAHMIVHKRRTFHFVCNECGVKFTSKANMKRHVQEHFNSKRFKCKVCGKTFHRNYYLVEHERIHTGTKLFSCSICGKNSSTKSNHRAHVKIHDARESGTLEG